MSESLSNPKPKQMIAIVGPCASGKSSLGERLRRQGYNVRTAAQEHSYVPGMWQISNPDYLIYLDVGLDTLRRRRGNPRWSEQEWRAQQQRLAHARHHADLVIATDALTLDEVEAQAKEMLAARSVRPKSPHSSPSATAKSLSRPTRLRFETRAAVAEDTAALAALLGLPANDALTSNRAVAVATDTPKANLYAEYGGELIGTIGWSEVYADGVVEVETPRLQANGYSERAVLSRLIRALPGLVDERAAILRYVVSLNQLVSVAGAKAKVALDEFQAAGYQFAAHKLVLHKEQPTEGEAAILLLDEDDSLARQQYEQCGYTLADELDYYEAAVHPSGFSLADYLRQRE